MTAEAGGRPAIKNRAADGGEGQDQGAPRRAVYSDPLHGRGGPQDDAAGAAGRRDHRRDRHARQKRDARLLHTSHPSGSRRRFPGFAHENASPGSLSPQRLSVPCRCPELREAEVPYNYNASLGGQNGIIEPKNLHFGIVNDMISVT